MSFFHDVNWQPDLAERRSFGRILAMGLPVIAGTFWLAIWLATGRFEPWPLWIGGIGAALGVICWAAPQIARPIYVVWFAVGGVMGLIVSTILLTAVFYLVITPTGIILRAIGRDPLARRFDPQASTYWDPAEKPMDAQSYFRQF